MQNIPHFSLSTWHVPNNTSRPASPLVENRLDDL